MRLTPTTAFLIAAVLASGAILEAMQKKLPDTVALERMTTRFAATDIGADVSALPRPERTALAKLIDAAKIMDAIFLRQVWAGNEATLLDLLKDESRLGRARLHYVIVNKGPWSRIDQNEPFIPGVPIKPEPANFYPAGTTKTEIESWINALPDAERTEATSFFTTIRRTPAGGPGQNRFAIVPFSLEYQNELARAAELLREAAAATTQPSLKNYLTKRAEAFLSNNYYESDMAWMDIDALIEPTIGPYEVYEDEWFNYKAAFEAFITLRNDAETQKLTRFSSELKDMENLRPIDASLRNPNLGPMP